MKAWENYFTIMQEVVANVMESQKENIMKAAKILADTTEKGGIIYGFGTGHSHLVTDDAFWRAATPANYCALLEQSATGSFEITKSYNIENTYGIGTLIVDYNRITSNDCMIIISNSGNNIAPIDAAIRAKEKGIPVIAITAVKYSEYLKTKHKSNVKLKDVADVVLDNGAKKGDAAFYIEGLDTPTGPTSDAIGIALAQALIASTIDKLVRAGHDAPVFKSSNVDGADDYNNKLFDMYYGYWK